MTAMTPALPHTHTRKTVTIVLHGKASDNLSDAAWQLRTTETQLASEAVKFYLSHLQKTSKFKPSVISIAGGLALMR